MEGRGDLDSSRSRSRFNRRENGRRGITTDKLTSKRSHPHLLNQQPYYQIDVVRGRVGH
jgi:hypothetical protein